jgi:hypothetical protein
MGQQTGGSCTQAPEMVAEALTASSEGLAPSLLAVSVEANIFVFLKICSVVFSGD